MTDARNTQEALELWAQGTPNAQATQISVEMWASVPALTVQALMTQIAVEQWASTASASAVQQAMAMILA